MPCTVCKGPVLGATRGAPVDSIYSMSTHTSHRSALRTKCLSCKVLLYHAFRFTTPSKMQLIQGKPACRELSSTTKHHRAPPSVPAQGQRH